MRLLLISNTAIIEHIFALVCKRLKIELFCVKSTSNITLHYDFIIIDQPFIDNNFMKLKRFSSKLGAISTEELSFDKPRDFLIPRPFLPSKLESILKEQINILKEDKETQITKSFENEDEEIISPVVDFISDSLDDETQDIEEDFLELENFEEDESIVNLSSLNKGGVLDHNELNKINTILKEEEKEEIQEADWKDISEIIDEALDEVKEYEFTLDENIYHLILNKFKIEELRPLLSKFNQEIIDKLVKGEAVDIKVSLKGDYNEQ